MFNQVEKQKECAAQIAGKNRIFATTKRRRR